MPLHEPAKAARLAGLRYVTDQQPGITRIRSGSSFRYLLPSEKPLKDPRHLARIRSLAIPPAWARVWICPHADGHIQATGLDARGRKQYRYHSGWTSHRNLAKFDTLAEFGASLPAIRARIDRDLRRPGMPREKVAAAIVHLMDRTAIRIGNSEYARDNDSYGLSTIRNNHAKVAGSQIRFRFRAKGGRLCEMSIDSPRIARIVRTCQELPGQELFCYVDDAGETHDIGSGDINQYLAEISGRAFTAKDFRTWTGTCAAAEALAAAGPPQTEGKPLSAAALSRREVAAVRAASEVLNNTLAVCRKFYVHPELIKAYADGRLHQAFRRAATARSPRLSLPERAVLLLFRQSAARKRAA
jgi:DNA topoisomerase I